MPPKPISRNTLFYGDNLPILREYVPSESVDLVYLDPPFNSNRSYNVLFKDESGAASEAQITAFDDTWHWGPTAEAAYYDLVTDAPAGIAKMISALREFVGANQMMAYLVMMAACLVELHRVLKPTGSLYLHCDPTASHYLKIVLDTIFGPANFRSEVIWKRTNAHNSAKRWGPIHDVLLFYSKTDNYFWGDIRQEYSSDYVEKYFKFDDNDGRGFYWTGDLTGSGTRQGDTGKPWKGFDPTLKGRHWAYPREELDRLDADRRIFWPKTQGAFPKLKRYLSEAKGIPLQDMVLDVYSMVTMGSNASESLGYPTQKPLALLERILQASSNPGDIVLDPFSGCGTAISAAQKLGRRWIGIDITHLAIAMHKSRLKDSFSLEPGRDYDVIGEPEDLTAARQLAHDDRYQFQWWALSLVRAKPVGGDESSRQGKKGSDRGIDGLITFIDDPKRKTQSAIVQVKSGHVKSGDIRDLIGTVQNQEAAFGIFITLEELTPEMITAASQAGFYVSPIWQEKYPKIQILTISALLGGASVQMPRFSQAAFKQAPRVKKSEGEQGELGI